MVVTLQMEMLRALDYQGADLDKFGYPVVTESGIRCGCCHKRHANVDTVKECYYIARQEEFEIRAEIEAEKRATRYWEEGY